LSRRRAFLLLFALPVLILLWVLGWGLIFISEPKPGKNRSQESDLDFFFASPTEEAPEISVATPQTGE
jgi:hypothetical protein